MTVAPPPPDEAGRLALLRALDLLDTEPEQAFDAVTRLVASVLGVPIAGVSLVDADRIWFKSRVGLDLAEAPRAVTFCAHAILADGPFVVADAPADPRFATNPFVVGEPGIRFYAGVPLLSSTGRPLGVLCAMDRVPKQLDAGQLQLLQDLAALARRELLNREAALAARTVAAENARAALEREALYHATFHRVAVGIAVVDLDGRFKRVNPELCRTTGRPANALEGLTPGDLTYPPDREPGAERLRELLAGRIEHYAVEKRYVRADASLVWVHVSVALIRVNGEPSHAVGVITDISARRAAEDALRDAARRLEQRVAERTAELERANDELSESMRLREASQRALERSEARLRAVLDGALDAFVGVDAGGVVHQWNRQAEAVFGWRADEAIGRSMNELFVPPDARGFHVGGLRTTGSRMLNRRVELPAQRRDGSHFPCEIAVTALPAPDGGVAHFAAFMRDITQRKEAERQLAEAAATDPLTGLPNRRSFEARAEAAMGRARRSGRRVALLFLDLDRFKSINDEHGHAAGDAVLKAFGARLRETLRESDTVARLAGDEFVALLEGIAPGRPGEVEGVAAKILAVARRPVAFGCSGSVTTGASIGIAIGDGHVPLERLLHDADLALYRAKQQGRDGFCMAGDATG